jgi:formate--tetrahydrofolate ligase
VALNRFATDAQDEIECVRARCAALDVPFAVADAFARGGAGGVDLARLVVERAEKRSRPFQPLYERGDPVVEKIRKVASAMYGARGVTLTKRAERDLREVERLGYGELPVCIAKVASSLTDDAHRVGRPRDFDVTVRELQINAGAGFLVVLTGDILRMPGLPRHPLAERIDLRGDEVVGV